MADSLAQVVFHGAAGYTPPAGRTGIIIVEDGASEILLFDDFAIQHRLWQRADDVFDFTHALMTAVTITQQFYFTHRLFELTQDRFQLQHRLWELDTDDFLFKHRLTGAIAGPADRYVSPPVDG